MGFKLPTMQYPEGFKFHVTVGGSAGHGISVGTSNVQLQVDDGVTWDRLLNDMGLSQTVSVTELIARGLFGVIPYGERTFDIGPLKYSITVVRHEPKRPAVP